MNPLAQLNKLQEIVDHWVHFGEANEQFYEAQEIVQWLETYAQKRPPSSYAAGKLPALRSTLYDLFHRDATSRREIASFETLAADARFYIRLLQESYNVVPE